MSISQTKSIKEEVSLGLTKPKVFIGMYSCDLKYGVPMRSLLSRSWCKSRRVSPPMTSLPLCGKSAWTNESVCILLLYIQKPKQMVQEGALTAFASVADSSRLKADDIVGNPAILEKGSVYYYSELGDRLIYLNALRDSLWQLLRWGYKHNKKQAAQLHMLSGWLQIVELQEGYPPWTIDLKYCSRAGAGGFDYLDQLTRVTFEIRKWKLLK
ncbi:hypothetical protein Tco_0542918 [Tanacetum coccineum]